jgi:Zn-finger nucleic acid-binding protein
LHTVRITGDDYFFIDDLSIKQRVIPNVELIRCCDCGSIWINEEHLQKRIDEEMKIIEMNKRK